MSENKYLPQLDGIRALAVLSVLISHFFPDNNLINRIFHFGRSGVVVFFVLSGYLITGILLRYRDTSEKTQQSKLHVLRTFYGRRVLRIFPIYYLMVFTAAILGFEPIRKYFLWHIFYASNMLTVLYGITFGSAGHLWSLCVEEQFYLLWPVMVIFIPKKFIRTSAIAMILLGMAFKFVGGSLGLNWYESNFSLIGCIDSLGLGALLAINQHEHRAANINNMSAYGGLAGLIILLILQVNRYFAVFDIRQEPYYQSLIDITIAFAFLPVFLGAIRNKPGRLAGLFNWSLFRYIGKISYGVYFYHLFVQAGFPILASKIGLHVPALGIGSFLFYSMLTIAVASASWYFYEKPINNLKKYIVLQPAPASK